MGMKIKVILVILFILILVLYVTTIFNPAISAQNSNTKNKGHNNIVKFYVV